VEYNVLFFSFSRPSVVQSLQGFKTLLCGSHLPQNPIFKTMRVERTTQVNILFTF